ncbi:MAG: acyl-CoA dehydratase activase [Spirochaetaceae bacterium]|jgi:predicted CoA-substrate-specific enzyme activase|nr:acyl-CoA dehydratase activase [Spirochaetaceae bacterium]
MNTEAFNKKNLHLGIDVGSTTVKAVLIHPETKEIVFSRYERHNACQSETVLAFLKEIFSKFQDAAFKLAVCGSGGRVIAEMINAPYIQEVVANSIAVRRFYPETSVAIELGGQDAKIVFFHRDPLSKKLSASDMRMNGSCAGGTGAFIDEVAALLRIKPEDFESLACKGTHVYDISGRCGVFAKTDIQPLLNQGALKEDIALSTFHAIAKQTIGGLAQGLEIKPPVIFEGGPLTFNPTLITVFGQRLNISGEQIIKPDNSEIMIAYGAALSIDEMFSEFPQSFSPEAALTSLSMFREILTSNRKKLNKPFFTTLKEKQEFLERHKIMTINSGPPSLEEEPANEHSLKKSQNPLRVYLGIDAGSTTSKFVLIDESENVVDSFYAPNKGEPLKVVREALINIYKKYTDAGIELKIEGCGSTGYGELLFDKAFGADYHTVETVAHAAAAQKYVPGVSFILDIGGQDMKAIYIHGGVVTNITLNEACSSGCGSFLENFASNLRIPVDKIAESSFNAVNPAELGSRCTVFMNSTIITEQKNGKKADDIMAGLCRSIIENVFTKVVRFSNINELGDKIVVQGGAFKNDAVLRALEQYLGKTVVRAPFPGEMGAIGIALLTKREIKENGYTSPHGSENKTRFIGLEALKNFTYTQEANLVCNFCANNCNRTLVRFSNGLTWVTGNRCERGEIIGDAKDPAIRDKVKRVSTQINSTPDMVKIREELLFADYPYTQVLPEKDITIGLPRALDFWRTMPFWKVFFRALGFKTKTSRQSSKKLYEKGLPFVASDTVCFPAKLVHGHIQDLIAENVDRIFLPQLNRLPAENPEAFSTFTCPVLKSYPLVIKYSDAPQRRSNIPLDSPVFHWFSKRDRDYQLRRYMADTFNINEEACKNAIAQADAVLDVFKDKLQSVAQEIIDDVSANGSYAVVLAGRHYQFDNVINHNLSRYFTSIGIPVITLDAMPGLKDVPLRKTALDITNNNHAMLLSGAILAAENKNLEYVQIYSFGCGHDALYTDEVTRIMNEISGKSPLILKLDESDVAGPLRIRVRSFIETVNTRRKKEAHKPKNLDDPFPVKFRRSDRKKTVLVPNVTRAFCLILSAGLSRQGFKAAPMDLGGKEAMALGKKYVHNDICFPAQMLIGEALAELKSGKYDINNVAVGTGKIMCDCRLTNYMALTRKALDAAGFSQVPIISTDIYDIKNIHPGLKFNLLTFARILWGLILADVLEELRRKIRPYEKEKGETDAVVEKAFEDIANALQKGGMPAAFFTYKKAVKRLCAVQYDRSRPRETVFIQGEYLLTFHPGSNYHIERYLEANGMEVALPRMHDIYRQLFVMHIVSEIKDFKVRHSLYDTIYGFLGDKYVDLALDIIEKPAKKHPLFEPCMRLPEMAKLSDEVMHHSVMSGESFMIAADILHNAAKGVKSFVILQPFGCLPNHICGRGVIKRIKELHPNIQILPLDYDPDVSFANTENRLQMLLMNARASA